MPQPPTATDCSAPSGAPSVARRGSPGRARRGLRALAALVLPTALSFGACSSAPAPAPAPTTTVTSSTPSASPTASTADVPATPALTPLGGGPVLAVKIDNTGPARPRIGLDSAAVVYVEPVEAGLTRLLAVFTTMPAEVGPVRSARESDVDLLGNYGRVAFAFSGGSAITLAAVAKGQQVNLSFDANPAGYRRDRSRPSPYNVIGSPTQLLARAGGSVPPGDVGLRFGPAPAGGASGTSVSTAYSAASVGLTWDAGTQRYLVTTDGRSETTAAGVRVGAASVIVQTVRTHLSANQDVNGAHTPVVEVVGSGPVTLLRDGRSWTGTWSRSARSAPTTFTSASGEQLALATGPVWVLLVPAGQGVTVR